MLARTTVEARAVIDTKIEMDAIAYKPKTRMNDRCRPVTAEKLTAGHSPEQRG